jgi:5'-3' exonuclease
MPNMPKIMEQKKRRHIQHVISEIKQKIKNKYESTFDENRKLFNEYYITIEKTNLKFIYDELSAFDYNNDICEMLPNIQSFKISSPHEIGEGEKKIMEDIILNQYSGSYVIISPDADLIILCLIQKNMLNKKNINNTFHIIRENKHNESIDVIDIDKLMESIINHLEKRINESFSQINNGLNNLFEVDMKRVCDDIILLLSLFGNDFMPRIKSLNVRNGFNIIFEVYVRHFTRTRNRYKYITFEEDNMYKINYDNLNSFIYKISENEHKLCIETFASQHYKNYGYINGTLESSFGSPYFYDKLNAYVNGFNKLMTYITTNIKSETEINATNIYEELLMTYSDKVVFIKQFIMFEAGINHLENEFLKLNQI